MCFGTFILLTFIRALGMPILSGGGDKRKHKDIMDSKKGD